MEGAGRDSLGGLLFKWVAPENSSDNYVGTNCASQVWNEEHCVRYNIKVLCIRLATVPDWEMKKRKTY